MNYTTARLQSSDSCRAWRPVTTITHNKLHHTHLTGGRRLLTESRHPVARWNPAAYSPVNTAAALAQWQRGSGALHSGTDTPSH